MQEALGTLIGVLAALLVLSSSTNQERAAQLAPDAGVTSSKGGWLSIALALLSCALILGMAAWSAFGIHRSAELARSSMQQQNATASGCRT